MIPLSEYPRPQLERKNDYFILNGEWDCEVLDKNNNVIKDGKIVVPYSPESKLSTFNHTLLPDEKLHYKKDIKLPFSFDSERERLILHFDGVDYKCDIYINGEKILTHRGGYLPFECEVNKKEFTIELIVEDPTETGEQERGKQSLKPSGIWYPAQSGIWKTVWIEKVPNDYINSIKITPDLSGIEIRVNTLSSDYVILSCGERKYTFLSNKNFRINIENPHLWSPEDPYLYYFTLEYKNDKVSSYFALRAFTIGKDEKEIKRFFLNGKPYFFHGVLDQGYYKDGLYTPPSDDEMVRDILLMKELGFNTLRKHIKIESLRWYYHCDRIGMIVLQDIPSGGGKYKAPIISFPLVLGSFLKDNHYSLFSRKDEAIRDEFEKNLLSTIDLLYNSPSISMWVPFNEGWGQFDSIRISREIKSSDPTRLVDSTSGWYDQGCGEINSKHVYFKKYKFRKDKKNRVVFLSECGGFGLSEEKSFSYKKLKSKEELTSKIVSFYKNEIIGAKKRGLSGCIYTQLSDVESEKNGFITYDRKEIKVDIDAIKQISKELLGL